MSNVSPDPTKPAPLPAELADNETDSPTSLETPVAGPREKPGPVMLVLQGLASLRLTVVLFILSFILVFLGTLAQIDYGIGTVIKQYFRSVYVLIPFRVLYQFGETFFAWPKQYAPPGYFPYPGGLTLGLLLMINLLMAHLLRFKISLARSGVLITHAGLTLLLLGEFITAFFAVEGRMRIEEGETSDKVININKAELAIISSADSSNDRVTTVPASFLRHRDQLISNDELPFDIRPGEWFINSDIRKPDLKFTTPQGWKETGPRKEGAGAIQVNILNAYAIEGGEKNEELTITSLPTGGHILAHINRWRGQVGLDDIKEEPAPIPVRVDEYPGKVYDLAGPQKRMLIAVVPRGEETWYYKLMGRSTLIQQHEARFFEFLRSAKPDAAENPATAGIGKSRIAIKLAEVSGTDSEQRVDTPSVYLTLLDKESGEEIGTYLFSTLLSEQGIKVGDTEYKVVLRFEETLRPFALTLKKFRFDRHPNTNIALNFSSLVQLRDPDTGEDREVLIRMNEPLRHRGETYFQSGWNERTERGTILQVVRNPGWLLPYFSCGIVALGLCIHFGISLANFLERKGV